MPKSLVIGSARNPKPFFARSLILSLPLMMSGTLFAHGWITNPPSRQESCAKHSNELDCGSLQWEPQSVEAPKGSTLCSGGGAYKVLDSDANWPVVTVDSTVEFTWKLTAPHRTRDWFYYVDGELAKVIDGKNEIPETTVVQSLEGLSEGPHTILGVWNIADTVNAFYNCIDVFVKPKNAVPPADTPIESDPVEAPISH